MVEVSGFSPRPSPMVWLVALAVALAVALRSPRARNTIQGQAPRPTGSKAQGPQGGGGEPLPWGGRGGARSSLDHVCPSTPGSNWGKLFRKFRHHQPVTPPPIGKFRDSEKDSAGGLIQETPNTEVFRYPKNALGAGFKRWKEHNTNSRILCRSI